jgi:hypothetical protein
VNCEVALGDDLGTGMVQIDPDKETQLRVQGVAFRGTGCDAAALALRPFCYSLT